MKHKGRVMVFLLCASALLLNGCALLLIGGAAAAGAGTVMYIKGELQSVEEASLEQVWKATEKAMKDLEYHVTTSEKDALSGNLVARTSGDTKVTIKLKSKSDTQTEIGIRVGTFGDEAMSRQILEKIQKHL